MKELPKIKPKKFEATYSLMMTREMKERLQELRQFHSIDVSEIIRTLISGFLEELDKKRGV